MKHTIKLTVNSNAVELNVKSNALLAEVLREDLMMTGTHIGCDTSQCGACVVNVDGKAIKSCSVYAVQLDGAEIVTVEGLAEKGNLSMLQQQFKKHHALQCGFCTPGMLVSAQDMLKRHGSSIDEATVRKELSGNICRCTGYHNIVRAILDTAQTIEEGAA
ncbi:MAG: (2Fe-2S)-binding protein [Arenicella sp.]